MKLKINNNINLIKSVAIINVIFIHATIFQLFVDNHLTNFVTQIITLYNLMARFAAPLFIMASGYLLLANDKLQENSKLFYCKRFNKVGIPFLFWLSFYGIYGFYKQEKLHTLLEFFHFIIKHNFYYHIWFVFVIIGIYSLVPLLRKLVKLVDFKTIVTLFMLSSLIKFISIFEFNSTLSELDFIFYLAYFLTGGFLSNKLIKHRINLFVTLILILFINLVAFVFNEKLLVKYGYTIQGFYLYSYFSPISIFNSLIVFYLLMISDIKVIKRYKVIYVISELSKNTLGIYLIHPVFLDLLFNYLTNNLFLLLIKSIFVLFISWLFVKQIKKIKYLAKIF